MALRQTVLGDDPARFPFAVGYAAGYEVGSTGTATPGPVLAVVGPEHFEGWHAVRGDIEAGNRSTRWTSGPARQLTRHMERPAEARSWKRAF